MFRRIAILIANIAALCETTLGLRQVMGLSLRRHAEFVMTGSFANPGPYGGCIAVLLAVLGSYSLMNIKVVHWYDKVLLWISVFSSAMCVVVLPASMSRAAWLGLVVAAVLFGFKEKNLSGWVATNKKASVVAVVAVVVLFTGVFLLKKDSAVGRLHIWHMELRAIAERPWTGFGAGRVLGVYGDVQAKYFSQAVRPSLVTKVAGCPEYAFNEYLKVGVEHGVPAMLLLVVLIGVTIHVLSVKRSPLAYGLVVLAVFAFFSYPVSGIRLKNDSWKKWESSRLLSSMGMYDEAVKEYSVLYPEMKANFRFLYDYGYALHKLDRHNESNRILKEGARISSDPMFYNIMGKNAEATGRFDEARELYLHSHFMVPSRFYPFILLMNMCERQGLHEEAVRYAETVVAMPVNKRNLNMVKLRDEAARFLDGE